MNDLATNLLKQRKKRIKLESKFQQLQDRLSERRKLSDKEKRQESKKDLSLKGRVNKFVRKSQIGVGGFFFSLFKLILTYKVVEWASKPENLKTLQGLAKGLLGIFKFMNFFVGGSIDNALTGLHDLIFGGTILEKFVGLLKGIVGLFGIRYLLNPFKLIKDLKFVTKNSGKILDIFKAFKTSGIKEGADALVKGFSKSAGLFKHGLSRGLARGFLSIFGKGGVKLLSKLFTPIKNIALGIFKAGAKKTVAGIPIIGPILDLGLNLVLGDPLDKALFKAGGSALGMGLGGLIGSVLPGPGTIVGGALGGILGDWAASKLYDSFKSKESKLPELAVGGIVTQPTKAIIGEAGPEAVIPLASIFSGGILQGPLSVIGSSLIGGVNALLISMGPIGNLVRPFATQLFAPYVRDYGKKNFTFSSDLGKKSAKSVDSTKPPKEDSELSKIIGISGIHLLKNKDAKPKTRYNRGNTIREILADIFNNIINLKTTTGTGGDTTTSGGAGAGGGGMLPGNAPPEVKAMLDAIAGGEGSWDSVNPGTSVAGLSNMTIADARRAAMNKGYAMGGSAAMGKWQQLPQYILKRARDSGLDPNKDKFNQENQTKIARMLMASVYPGGEAQLVKDAQQDPLRASAKLRGTWPSLPGGTQENAHSRGFLSRYNANVDKYSKMQKGGVVNPVPSQNIATNKGGYPADTGLDILTPIGSRVVSPVSGILEYAEKGHVRQMGQDANPNLAGMQDQHSVRIKLDKPFKFAGKQVNFFYATHLYKLNSAIANKSGTKINAGDLLGLSGVANNVPHVHVGFVEDRNQNTFLNYQQVRSLLSGSPVQDAGHQVETDSTQQEQPEETFNPANVAKMLGQLYRGLTGVPKNDTSGLLRNSMDLIQSRKQLPLMSDIYMITPSSTVLNNVNVMMPLPSEQFNTASTSFASLDTPFYTPRKL